MSLKLKASLVLCNVPTADSIQARAFYNSLLGVGEFAPTPNEDVAESYFAPISDDGIDLTITSRYDDSERLTCYFAVEDLNAAITELTAAGGRLAVPPRTVSAGSERAQRLRRARGGARGSEFGPSVGTMAVMLDPDGNHVGLMQIQEEAARRHFRAGRFARPIPDSDVREFEEARDLGRQVRETR
jgi:predicted enzyme related to lactoylglutathione lyase